MNANAPLVPFRVLQMVTSGVVSGIGDLLSQGIARGGFIAMIRALEIQRLALYSAVGCFYLAPLIHFWFMFLERITAPKVGYL
jgi:hypothetical protein